jgi:archaemetzincin
MSSLLIVPIGSHPVPALPSLVARLRSVFGLGVSVASPGKIDPAPSFNVSRNQYFSTQLLLSLLETFPNTDGKLLGITSLDLYVPVLTYVFGEAQLDGRSAVISFHRLDETFYGFPSNEELLVERLEKEAIHELGHTFGLVHCENYMCVMHSSTAVEEVDVRPSDFCVDCGRMLKERIARGGPSATTSP